MRGSLCIEFLGGKRLEITDACLLLVVVFDEVDENRVAIKHTHDLCIIVLLVCIEQGKAPISNSEAWRGYW